MDFHAAGGNQRLSGWKSTACLVLGSGLLIISQARGLRQRQPRRDSAAPRCPRCCTSGLHPGDAHGEACLQRWSLAHAKGPPHRGASTGALPLADGLPLGARSSLLHSWAQYGSGVDADGERMALDTMVAGLDAAAARYDFAHDPLHRTWGARLRVKGLVDESTVARGNRVNPRAACALALTHRPSTCGLLGAPAVGVLWIARPRQDIQHSRQVTPAMLDGQSATRVAGQTCPHVYPQEICASRHRVPQLWAQHSNASFRYLLYKSGALRPDVTHMWRGLRSLDNRSGFMNHRRWTNLRRCCEFASHLFIRGWPAPAAVQAPRRPCSADSRFGLPTASRRTYHA